MRTAQGRAARPAGRAYQDQYVRGQVTARGYRDCAVRYALLRRALRGLRPHPTILDFGAAGGYFAFRLAHDLDARVTAVDDAPALRAAAKANGDRRVTVIARRLTLEEVRGLGHFDVVLALSVLHHVSPWRDYLAAFRRAARRALILELPDPRNSATRSGSLPHPRDV